MINKYNMIFIYGDSHGKFNFNGLKYPHKNYSVTAKTMNRVGRDQQICIYENGSNDQVFAHYNMDITEHKKEDIICFNFGEVDCRYHIHNQINKGRKEDEIIQTLIFSFFITIRKYMNYKKHLKIIIIAIISPASVEEYKALNNEQNKSVYPFLGTDEERVRYTKKANDLIKKYCDQFKFCYFNPFSYCTKENGTMDLKYGNDFDIHLLDNKEFLNQFYKLYDSIVQPPPEISYGDF